MKKLLSFFIGLVFCFSIMPVMPVSAMSSHEFVVSASKTAFIGRRPMDIKVSIVGNSRDAQRFSFSVSLYHGGTDGSSMVLPGGNVDDIADWTEDGKENITYHYEGTIKKGEEFGVRIFTHSAKTVGNYRFFEVKDNLTSKIVSSGNIQLLPLTGETLRGKLVNLMSPEVSAGDTANMGVSLYSGKLGTFVLDNPQTKCKGVSFSSLMISQGGSSYAWLQFYVDTSVGTKPGRCDLTIDFYQKEYPSDRRTLSGYVIVK